MTAVIESLEIHLKVFHGKALDGGLAWDRVNTLFDFVDVKHWISNQVVVRMTHQRTMLVFLVLICSHLEKVTKVANWGDILAINQQNSE